MKINSVIVVGGGSSGWCTAAALAKFCPDLKITVIESKEVPTVGVGESTIQYFNNFIKLLDLKDQDWMPFCNATYKSAIKFTGFNKGEYYYAPFKDISQMDRERLRNWSILRAIDKNITPSHFAKYIWPGSYLLDENKVVGADSSVNFSIEDNTSYNLDSALFGVYLRDHYCKPRGVTHIVDTINDVELDDDGFIKSLNGQYQADLFIDCTGFSSLLLEKAMGSKFIKYDELFNDKAVVFNSIEYKDKNTEMETYTNTIAKDYGWIWNIPLWNRISNGYVYSSKFTTDEQALEHLTEHVKQVRGHADHKPFYVDIKNGRHERAWIKNVVGIGLSFGFIEPLGSTGLLLTQRGVIRLVTQLNSRNFEFNAFDIEGFNHFYNDLIDSLKDFYLIHFVTTTREDTPYWKYIKHELLTDSESFKRIQNRISYTVSDTLNFNPIDIFHWQMYGMGYQGYTIEMLNHKITNGGMIKFGQHLVDDFWKTDAKITKHVANMPTLYQFLSENIYKNT